MSKIMVFWMGILGVAFFGLASVLGGFQFDDYDPVSQYISETMAVGTPYGQMLRFMGYIPSGILLAIFCFASIGKFPKSNRVKVGFWGLGVFYGFATVVVGIFPCDIGCNKELVDPSISQLIHNLTGFLTYLFVPISIILIGAGIRRFNSYRRLSTIGFVCGSICILFVGMLMADPLTNYAGLFQRIVEGTFIVWIVACAFSVKAGKHAPNLPR